MVGIVLPSSPSKTERFAAEELGRYLNASVGWDAQISECKPAEGTLPVFWVGNVDVERLKPAGYPSIALEKMSSLTEDGVYLHGDGKNVILTGKGRRGALHAVYTFLDSIGCKWPEPGVEFVPKLKDVDLNKIEILSNPAFRYRGIAIHGITRPETFGKIVDWLGKNRMNGFQLFPDMYDGFRAKYLEDILKRGLEPNIGAHSREFFYPHAKYSKDHPEYFALTGGKRGTQLCYSDLRSIPEYAKNVVTYLKSHTEIEMVGLWPSDGYGFCECDKCKAGPMTDIILNYINELMREVNKELPNMKGEFLSYISYVTPPARVKPIPNVVPTYCEYTTRTQFRPITLDLMDNAKHRANLEKWISVSKDVTVFSYYGDDCIKRYLYDDISDTVFADFKYYQKIGLAGHFVLLVNPESWWANAPHIYACTRALWDPNTPVAKLEDDYYRSVYGPAARSMKAHAKACRELLDLKTAHGQTLQDVFWYFNINDFDPVKDSEVRKKADAIVLRIKKSLADARAANPNPNALASISKLASDASYVGLTYDALFDMHRAILEKTREARIRVADLIARAADEEVVREDSWKLGSRFAHTYLLILGLRAMGLPWNDQAWFSSSWNQVPAFSDYARYGVWRWNAVDVQPSSKGDPKQVMLDVTDSVKSEGGYSVTWQYLAGDDAIEILSTSLCSASSEAAEPENLTVLSTDEHVGHTGASDSNNIYALKLATYDPSLRYYLTGHVYDQRDLNTYGQVLLKKLD